VKGTEESMKKYIFFTVSVFALLILFQVDIFACRCVIDPNQTLEQKINANLKTAKAVFSGEVVEIYSSFFGQDPPKQNILVRIKVEESWKEILPEEINIVTNISSCGYRFEKGKSYLVFAYSSDEYNLSTAKCLLNKELENAADELKILGKGKKDKLTCPTIGLSSRTKDLPKDSWIYSARIKNNDPNLKLTYKWEYWIGDKISEIKSGQGTQQITIEKVNLNTGILVGLKIGGLPTGCENWTARSVIE
jgi:hypothetical protein